jgi:hypothetical protein
MLVAPTSARGSALAFSIAAQFIDGETGSGKRQRMPEGNAIGHTHGSASSGAKA